MLKIVTDNPTDDAGDEQFSLERKKFDYKACKHKAVEIDPDLRIATCRSCGEKLDPIEVCLNFVNWIREQRAYFEFIQNTMASHREKEAEKRKNSKRLCRRCRKMFVEAADERGVISHCGICDPCWAKSPMHMRDDFAPLAPSKSGVGKRPSGGAA